MITIISKLYKEIQEEAIKRLMKSSRGINKRNLICYIELNLTPREFRPIDI